MPTEPLSTVLARKLAVTARHVNRLIATRSNELFLTRRLATLSLARDAGINVAKYATDDEMTTLRGVKEQEIDNGAVTPMAPRLMPQRTRVAVERTAARDQPRVRSKPKDARKVFVVHGRDKQIRDSLFRFLRSIGLDPIEWGQAMKATGKAQPSIPETVDAAFNEGAAVVILLTPDDVVYLSPRLRRPKEPQIETTPSGQARPNVLFEAGLAFGLHPNATVLVSVGDVKPFSDVSGLHITKLNNSPQRRSEFIEKLKLAGAAVDVDGRQDWYSEGTFEIEED